MYILQKTNQKEKKKKNKTKKQKKENTHLGICIVEKKDAVCDESLWWDVDVSRDSERKNMHVLEDTPRCRSRWMHVGPS